MMNETKRLAYVNYEMHARVELENKGNLGMQGLAHNKCDGWVIPIFTEESKIKTAKNGNKYIFGEHLVIFDRSPDRITQAYYRENWDSEIIYSARLINMIAFADKDGKFVPRYFSGTNYNGYLNPVYGNKEMPEAVELFCGFLEGKVTEEEVDKRMEEIYQGYKRDDRHGRDIYKKY